ncbi:MAG: N-acetyltransferase family protein [Leadbetterella sp.]|nr:N-acetyltransferase family protein [Leadbetterella sp.]
MTNIDPLHYRFAVPEDLEEIVRIYNSTIPSRLVTADLTPVSVESRKEWFSRHTPKRPLWVVEEHGKTIGWLGFQPFHSRIAYDGTAEISLYLDESVRGLGLGRQVLDFASETASGLGIETLIGLIFEHNIPSIRLFEKAGYSEWGFLPGVANLDGVRRGLKYFGKRVYQ